MCMRRIERNRTFKKEKHWRIFFLLMAIFSLFIITYGIMTIRNSRNRANSDTLESTIGTESASTDSAKSDTDINELTIAAMERPGTRIISGDSSFFVDNNGVLWSWGKNTYGQLGQGTVSSHNKILEPAVVTDRVEQVFSGVNYTIALKTDHSLWAFGDNEHGQLGTGDNENRNTPEKIMSDIVTVSASDQVLALKKDGSLWAWGWNYNGCVGNGTYDNQNKPVKVMDNVKAIHARSRFSMALTNDNSLWMWGKNTNGALGNGSYRDKTTPVKVIEGVKEISSIDATPYCLTEDGDLYAWGEYTLFGKIRPAPDKPYVNKPYLVKSGVAKLGYCTNDSAVAFMNTDGSIDCVSIYYDMYTEFYRDIFRSYRFSTSDIRELHCYVDTKKTPEVPWGYSRVYSPGVSVIDDGGNLMRWIALEDSASLFDSNVATFMSNNWINLILKTDGSLYSCANEDNKRIFIGGPQLPSEPMIVFDLNNAWDASNSTSVENEQQATDQEDGDWKEYLPGGTKYFQTWDIPSIGGT